MPDCAANERETKLPSTDSFPPESDLEPLSQYETFNRSELKDPTDFYYRRTPN